MNFKKLMALVAFLFTLHIANAAYMLIPMEADKQADHLKAYGMMYWILDKDVEGWWLLNYRGGAFAFPSNRLFEKECLTRGVSYEVIPDAAFNKIVTDISNPDVNMDAMKLEKAPKIAVYTPEFSRFGERIQPWDDAVTLVLTYAEIPYEQIYDDQVLDDKLAEYDWLHLHHEDFTGQYGRFYKNYRNAPWYKDFVKRMEEIAERNGYAKVSQMKLDVVKKIQEYVVGGGFMFAMCSATDSYDIALAANGVDICAKYYDGDGPDPNAQSKLNYHDCFAFENFELMKDPLVYEFSTVDHYFGRNSKVPADQDYFTLFDFSAKFDPVPTMLTQNHTRTVKGFMGQTTAFHKEFVKPNVRILGENKPAGEVRYLHGTVHKGFFTFYGGHDPEDYRHYVEEPPTDLNLHPNSPGYRLILNNVLFPAAKKKKRKT